MSVRIAGRRDTALMQVKARPSESESFGRYLSALYADRFDSYCGQQLWKVTDEQPASSGIKILRRIIDSGGEPVEVNYLMPRMANPG